MAHRQRAVLAEGTPVHVVMRAVDDVPSLRQTQAVNWVRRCIQLAHKEAFRVCEFSVQDNHLHFIVEARDEVALARGMQGLKIRIARRLNALFERRSTFFTDRYHARPLTSPPQVRHFLWVVLCNVRKHGAERGETFARDWVDPYSSAPTFDGWTHDVVTDADATPPGVTRRPEFPLLRTAWKRYGLLDPNTPPTRAG